MANYRYTKDIVDAGGFFVVRLLCVCASFWNSNDDSTRATKSKSETEKRRGERERVKKHGRYIVGAHNNFMRIYQNKTNKQISDERFEQTGWMRIRIYMDAIECECKILYCPYIADMLKDKYVNKCKYTWVFHRQMYIYTCIYGIVLFKHEV